MEKQRRADRGRVNVHAGPLIIAHRGASALAPENTLAAFRSAIDIDADGVELDVQLSKDGVPVVIHDLTLRRTAQRPGRVADLTAAELGKIDVGSWFNAKFSGETVPSLGQVLELHSGFGGLVYIELKFGKAYDKALAFAVSEMIRDSPLLPQIVVKSFHPAAIAEVPHLLPDVQTAALFDLTVRNLVRSRKRLVSTARQYGAHQLSLHRSLVTVNLMTAARDADMHVTVWTVDHPRWIEHARRLGVRALITNDPAKLLAARDD